MSSIRMWQKWNIEIPPRLGYQEKLGYGETPGPRLEKFIFQRTLEISEKTLEKWVR